LNRFDKVALAAVIAMTLLCARGQLRIAHFYLDPLHFSGKKLSATVAIWAAGWVIATYGPMAIAACFWRWTKRARAAWIFHILLLPCAVVTWNAGQSIMLLVIKDPDFDGTLGGPVMPAALLLLVAVGGYFAALISRQIRRTGEQAEVS
jgi:hypothetical protein